MPDMPQWAQVWFWLRFRRDPQVMRGLPQQRPAGDDHMSSADFDRYLAEWQAAGSPTVTPGQVAAVLSGALISDDIPF